MQIKTYNTDYIISVMDGLRQNYIDCFVLTKGVIHRLQGNDPLFFSLTLSLIIHILIFVILPYGSFRLLGSGGESQEYGFLQLVEYQAAETYSNQRSQTTDPASTVKEPVPEPEPAVVPQPEIEPEPIPDPEPEPEPEPEPIPEPEPEVEPEPEPEIEADPAAESDQNILTSETGEMEIEIDPETDISTGTEESHDGNGTSNGEGGKTTVQSPPPPPPPPSAGELLLYTSHCLSKDLQANLISGTVIVEVISSDGEIDDIYIIRSNGIKQMEDVG